MSYLFHFGKKVKIAKTTYIGDIVISYDFMNKPKKLKLENFKKKLIKTFIHGFLHLLNFDHKKDLKILKNVEKRRTNI